MRAIRNSCSICMGSLKNPKVISCHHSFCSKCLDDYVRVKLRNGRFDCPLCRTSVELPKGGVSGFETNIYFESDLIFNFESTKLSNEEREKTLREARENKAREEREKKARVKTPIRVLPEEEREKQGTSQRMEARVKDLEEELSNTRKHYEEAKASSQGMEARDKALNEELFTTRKQHQEANANAITKGTKLTQAEMEIQALRNQIADYFAQSQRTEARVKALEEGLSSTRKQYEDAKANSQRMEARVKALEEGLSSQYEEVKANEEREKKEREGKQIQVYHSKYPHLEYTDETIKTWMCPTCQGWRPGYFPLLPVRCQCGANK